MPLFTTNPRNCDAIQFTGKNWIDVAEFVKALFQNIKDFSVQSELKGGDDITRNYVFFSSGDHCATVTFGDWLVVLDGFPLVMSNDRFLKLFQPLLPEPHFNKPCCRPTANIPTLDCVGGERAKVSFKQQ